MAKNVTRNRGDFSRRMLLYIIENFPEFSIYLQELTTNIVSNHYYFPGETHSDILITPYSLDSDDKYFIALHIYNIDGTDSNCRCDLLVLNPNKSSYALWNDSSEQIIKELDVHSFGEEEIYSRKKLVDGDPLESARIFFTEIISITSRVIMDKNFYYHAWLSREEYKSKLSLISDAVSGERRNTKFVEAVKMLKLIPDEQVLYSNTIAGTSKETSNHEIPDTTEHLKQSVKTGDTKIYHVNEFNPSLGIDMIASAMANLFNEIDFREAKGLVGIFGRWGRGKTYFFNYLWDGYLSKEESAQKKYCRIDFNAWKYQDTPASWAYLYDEIVNAYTENFDSFKKTLSRFKAVDWICVLLPVFVILIRGFFFLFKRVISTKFYQRIILNYEKDKSKIRLFWFTTVLLTVLKCIGIIDIVNGITNAFNSLYLLIGIGGFLWLIFLLSRSIKAFRVFSKHFHVNHYHKLLGYQKEIEDEIALVVNTWVSRNEDEQLVLFVDDLDRCSIEKSLEVIDSIRLMLDNKTISEKLICVMAVDEGILRKCIQYKFKEIITKESNEIGRFTKEYFDKLFVFGIRLGKLNTDDTTGVIDNVVRAVESKNKLYKYGFDTDKLLDIEVGIGLKESLEKIIIPDSKGNTAKASTIGELQDRIEQDEKEGKSNSITPEEKKMIIDLARNLNDPTPRTIKILLFKYLFARELLNPKDREVHAGQLMNALVYIENNWESQPSEIINNIKNGGWTNEEMGITPDAGTTDANRFYLALETVSY